MQFATTVIVSCWFSFRFTPLLDRAFRLLLPHLLYFSVTLMGSDGIHLVRISRMAIAKFDSPLSIAPSEDEPIWFTLESVAADDLPKEALVSIPIIRSTIKFWSEGEE